jgi:glycosyltransferase involved in cell wall biosynthesis
MNILIVEPEYQGHHVALHINALLKEFNNRNWVISILAYEKSVNSEAYKIIDNNLLKKITFFKIKNLKFNNRKDFFYLFYVQLVKYIKIISSINDIFKKKRIDHVYFGTFDHIDKILSIFYFFFKKKTFSGLLVYSKVYLDKSNNFFDNVNKFIKKYLLVRMINISSLRYLFVVDELLYNFLKKHIKNNINKLVYVPDPGNIHFNINQNKAKNLLKINKNDFLILVYGAIKMSKGIKQLLLSIQKIKEKKIRILIAGKQTKDVRIFLKNRIVQNLIELNRILIKDNFQNYKDEAVLFSAANVVWVAYTNDFFGSSSVLYLAGSAKKPVITNKLGLLGYINKKNKIGLCVNIEKEKDIINKILYLYYNKDKRSQLGKNNYDLSKFHTTNNFSKIIANRISHDVK